MTQSEQTFTSTDIDYMKKNYEELAEVPDGMFFASQLPSIPGSRLIDWMDHGFIRKVGEFCQNGKPVCVWEPTEQFLEERSKYGLAGRPMEMPCGHTGIHNDGDWIRCKVCEGRWSKQEVEDYVR